MTQASNAAQRQLQDAMQDRMVAKGMEEEAKQIKQDANEVIEQILDEIGEDKYAHDEYGKISREVSTRTSFDTGKIREHLVNAGVNTKIINTAFKKAQKDKVVSAIRFTAPKKG